jgi:aspartyl aminopeptidase
MHTLTKTSSMLLFAGALLATPAAQAADKKKEDKAPQSGWLAYSAKQLKQVEDYSRDFKSFIHKARTELTFVQETTKLAQKAGFKPLQSDSPMTPGARYYDINRDRAMTLITVGTKPGSEGMRIIGSHIDSPRIELKGNPLYEKEGFAMFQTYVHGGIKTYQWVNVPLALLGQVSKKDGTTVQISVGLEADDPVLMIPDLAPHVDKDYRKRTQQDVIDKEELDPIVASRPGIDIAVKQQVEDLLKKRYNVSLEDLVSAELVLVPAMEPRDVGLDRSMVAAYGQDDKLSAYASIRALFEEKSPAYTSLAFLVDNEEVSNINNTGANSSYLVDLMAQLLYQQDPKTYSDIQLRQVLRKTKVVSADVNPGVNPNWPGVWDLQNAPRLGEGVNLKLYGGGFNANSEYIAWTRNYLDNSKIMWQTSTYKGKASGGTIGSSLSKHNMDVIDFGIPVLSIHSPYAVSSKVDMYSLYMAMQAFYQQKD